ncbi:hypothetical protein FJN17_12195 [Bradyrhizobium symbiodeficiens]|uniref:Uncharacterized protein n=1 Tax=Bradyrhizobium symbiodeficiens TaxID=1404367 RepID=A0ABX5W4Q5_9BRAD|nr:hypothetical protein [Bradyrhizobium symbiodeficiens]QDF38268.1 hypothetical protein FJN17_12195 [Bradyrhizobium symbiodeficiens]
MKILSRFVLAVALAVGASAVSAQQYNAVPDKTVIGRIGAGSGSGPSQAITFDQLAAQLALKGSVFAPLARVATATVASGGSCASNGAFTATTTGGAGTQATISLQAVGGQITSVNSIVTPGAWYQNPSTPNAVTIAGCSGVTLNLTFTGATAGNAIIIGATQGTLADAGAPPALATTSITAAAPLSGGGTLASSRTIGLAAGTLDTALGYWGSTTASATAVNNCTGALTYSTSTHTFGCNAGAGTGNVVVSGTPSANQIAQWTSATDIKGTGFGTLQLTSVHQSANPANPGGTANTTGVMMGLGATCKVTPATTGRVRFTIIGNVTNNNTSKNTTVIGRYGTGTAPSNAAALTGTVFDSGRTYSTTGAGSPLMLFAAEGIISGLTVGTQVWYDASVATNDAGTTSSISSIQCLAQEF